jgi:hypothetical protein
LALVAVAGGFDGHGCCRRSAFSRRVAFMLIHSTRGRTRTLSTQRPHRHILLSNLVNGWKLSI